ncbi:hypothetical protein PpBr36_07197 [Pyricularia pennisetigena]|uniref:hypothetical protein n=1 Tax=Pyricularia pennisetigena TaxID=1578925 RepID=UPI001151720D|nr:hypothetical protein PpBr36_07197 [Pyricularia pennisetigena]TLS25394.1 hypothetical protein PpBr36_07197 [Pyricularia pennisetigena]
MLLRLSRTAQANARGHCRACLTLPSWCPIVTPWTISRQPLRRHQRSFGGGPVGEDEFFDITEKEAQIDETMDEITSIPRNGTTVPRTAVGELKAGGPRRAWLDRRIYRITSSLPCITEPGKDPEGPWSMDNDNEGVASAIEAICVPQKLLKDSERTLPQREAHLNSIRAIYFATNRLDSSAIDLGQIAEAQHDEEKTHVKSVQESGKLSNGSESRREEAEDVVYDPRGSPLHETDIQQLDAANIQEELLHHGPYRGPRKDVHVEQNRERINELVDALMTQAVTERFRGELKPIRRALESLDGPCTALEMLRKEGYPRYQSAKTDPVAAAEGIKKINDHARMVFAQWERAIIQEKSQRRPYRKTNEGSALTTTMLYKICFNLLTQVYEPEVHTFNTLMLGFTMVGEHRLARIVMESFLRTKMMPTKATIAIILHHYYASNDILGFYHWVRRMIGLDVKGVGIRRVQLSEIGDDDKTFLSWAQQKNVALRGGWLVTRSWLEANEMEALLKGLIYFGQAQHAAQILSISLKRGHAVQTSTFIDLLALIGSRLDHDAASLLVRGLCANSRDLTSLLLEEDGSARSKILVTQLRRVFAIYAARLHMPMATDKFNWAKLPADWEDKDALQHRHDVYVKTALLLSADYPRRTSEVDGLFPGLSTIVIALRIKEISVYLCQLDRDLKNVELKIKQAVQRIHDATRQRDISLAPKLKAWWRQRFLFSPEERTIKMTVHRYKRLLNRRRMYRGMARLHILTEQIDILTWGVAECIDTFSQMPFVPSELKDAMYLSLASVSIDSCVKLAYRHYNWEWAAAAQGHKKINAPFYEAALQRGKWSWEDIKRLNVEANIAMKASLYLSYEIKATMARLLPPNFEKLLLDAYGTWRRVPIEELVQYCTGIVNKSLPRAEDKETRLVRPVVDYWSRKTNPYHYLPST